MLSVIFSKSASILASNETSSPCGVAYSKRCLSLSVKLIHCLNTKNKKNNKIADIKTTVVTAKTPARSLHFRLNAFPSGFSFDTIVLYKGTHIIYKMTDQNRTVVYGEKIAISNITNKPKMTKSKIFCNADLFKIDTSLIFSRAI